MADKWFDGLAVKLDGPEGEILAGGYQNGWMRPLILEKGSTGALRQLDGKTVVQVCAVTRTWEELAAEEEKLQDHGVLVKEYLPIPLAGAVYFKKQKVIAGTTKKILVIDVESGFSEVSLVEHQNGSLRLDCSRRLEYGKDRLREWLYQFYKAQLERTGVRVGGRIEMERTVQRESTCSLERLIHSHTSKDCFLVEAPEYKKYVRVRIYRKDFEQLLRRLAEPILAAADQVGKSGGRENPLILLMGSIFESDKMTALFRERNSKYRTIVYRPGEAAILGASYYAHEKYPNLWGMQAAGESHFYPASPICNLPDSSWKACRLLYEGILGQQSVVKLPITTSQELLEVYRELRSRHPETDLLWNYGKSHYMQVRTTGNSHVGTEMKVILTYKEDGRKLLEQIRKKAEQIIDASVRGRCLTDMELLESLYTYMAGHYVYSAQQKCGTYPDYAYTLEALLKNGVCSGYAWSMKYLLNALQIPCMYISGSADGGNRSIDGHAWNIVQLYDCYRHFDVTWDLGNSLGRKRYYILDDISMRARRHMWNKVDYPQCV